MASGLIGLHPPRTLHEDAGDNLETVGDPVLEFLEQDRLLAKQVVLELLADPRLGDVGNCQKKTNLFSIAVLKLLGIEDEPARRGITFEVHLIGLDPCMAG